jgi:hypothetical protein
MIEDLFRNWLALAPALLIGLIYYAFVIFCAWKFYQMLSRINDNLTGIRQAIDDTRVKPTVQ